MVIVVFNIQQLVLMMLVPILYFNIILVHFITRNLLNIWKHILQIILAVSKPRWYLIKNLQIFLRKVDGDTRLGLPSEALENTALGLLSTPKLLLLFSREIALVVFGVRLDKGLNCVWNLLVANAAPNVVKNVLNVLQTSSFYRFQVAVETTFENNYESWVHGN